MVGETSVGSPAVGEWSRAKRRQERSAAREVPVPRERSSAREVVVSLSAMRRQERSAAREHCPAH